MVLEIDLVDKLDLVVEQNSQVLSGDIVIVDHIDLEDVLGVDYVDDSVANKDSHLVAADMDYMVLVLVDSKLDSKSVD